MTDPKKSYPGSIIEDIKTLTEHFKDPNCFNPGKHSMDMSVALYRLGDFLKDPDFPITETQMKNRPLQFYLDSSDFRWEKAKFDVRWDFVMEIQKATGKAWFPLVRATPRQVDVENELSTSKYYPWVIGSNYSSLSLRLCDTWQWPKDIAIAIAKALNNTTETNTSIEYQKLSIVNCPELRQYRRNIKIEFQNHIALDTLRSQLDFKEKNPSFIFNSYFEGNQIINGLPEPQYSVRRLNQPPLELKGKTHFPYLVAEEIIRTINECLASLRQEHKLESHT